MSKKVLLLNGPNLNMLGLRQPELYGASTLADVEAKITEMAAPSWSVDCKQSNYEGQLVEWIQDAREAFDAIIINPAAYSHTSVAILDALNIFEGYVAEVHISDIHAREEFRHHSFVSYRADEIVIGKGVQRYEIALKAVASALGVVLGETA